MSHVLKDVEGFEKRADMFYVDPRKVKVVQGWNDRTDFTGEEELVASIKEIGVKQPIKVKRTKEKELELVDGERRLRATLKAIEQGSDIKSIPALVVSPKASEIDIYLDSIVSNTGKPLTPIEEANSFKRLIAWGISVQEIANKSGRSISHIRNRLELANAIPAVKEAVQNGDITVNDAQGMVKDSDGKVEPQKEALEKKKAEGKKPKKKIVHMHISSGTFKSKTNETDLLSLFDVLMDIGFRRKISEQGYDPDSIKLNIAKKND
jgi:ParB/RepB/Spo0J family partition protein